MFLTIRNMCSYGCLNDVERHRSLASCCLESRRDAARSISYHRQVAQIYIRQQRRRGRCVYGMDAKPSISDDVALRLNNVCMCICVIVWCFEHNRPCVSAQGSCYSKVVDNIHLSMLKRILCDMWHNDHFNRAALMRIELLHTHTHDHSWAYKSRANHQTYVKRGGIYWIYRRNPWES